MKTSQIQASDGISLNITEFGNGHAKAVSIIFNCATAVPQQFYYKYADYIAQHGYHCICWDYRGIGKSVGDTIKNKDYSLNHWGNEDLSAILTYIKETNPQNKIIVYGHSIGGAILGFTPKYGMIDAMVFHAVQTAYFIDWRFPHSIRLFFEWHVLLPIVTWIMGYFPGPKFGLGTNIQRGYVRHWSRRFRHPDVTVLFRKMAKGKIYFDQYKCPIFCFNMTDDYIATPKAVNRMNKAFENASIESIWINPIDYGLEKVGHFDFFKSRHKDQLWLMSLKWLEKVID